MSFSDYDRHDALGLAELVKKGAVSPSELVDEAISRVQAVNPELNAVVIPMFEEARKRAAGPLPDGPFRGVPFLLKDLRAAYAGVPLRAGSRLLADYVPAHDAGMRIDPPPSPPCAAGTTPAATAAAEPPLDPPGVCAGFHGFRVGP